MPPSNRTVSPLRLLLALTALALSAGAFFVLPVSLAPMVFWGLCALVAGAVVWRSKPWQWWHFRPRRFTLTLPRVVVTPLTLVTSLIGLGCLARSAYLFLPSPYLEVAQFGLIFFLMGALLLGLSLRHLSLTVAINPPDSTPQAPIRWHIFWVGTVLVLAVVQVHFLLEDKRFAPISYHLQILALIVGWALAAAGLCGLRWRSLVRAWSSVRAWHWSWHGVLLGLVVIIALYARVYNLEFGIHRWIDEINFLDAINQLKTTSNQAILMPFGGITAFSWFYPYTQWLSYSLLGPSVMAVRLPSALFGVGQVLALYLLVRTIFDKRTALLSALVLATFPPAIHFARIGINNVADPLFGLLAFAFVARSALHYRRTDMVLAGLFLGLSHYFYEGGRLFFTLFTACWIAWMMLTVRRPLRLDSALKALPKRQWMFGVVMLLLVIMPLYSVWVYQNKPLFPRFQAVGRDATSLSQSVIEAPNLITYAWQQVRLPLLSYTFQPDGGAFYHNDTGFILPIFVPFFLLGMAFCLWRWRTVGGGLVWWWCIATAVANAFVTNSVDAPRYCVVFPALCLGIALGMTVTWEFFERHAHRYGLRLIAWDAVMAVFIGVICVGQLHYYLGYHQQQYYLRQFYYEVDRSNYVWPKDMDDMIFRALQLPAPVQVNVYARGFSNVFAFGATLFYFDRTEAGDMGFTWDYADNLDVNALRNLPHDVLEAFFVEPSDGETINFIKQFFTLEGPYFSPFDVPKERQMALYLAYPRDQKP